MPNAQCPVPDASPVPSPVPYLDNNATTQPSDAVARAMDAANREHWQNPSSVHRQGQGVRAQVELARERVAALIGASPREIVFTATGTEAIDLAIRGSLAARRKDVLITDPVEHAAVRQLAIELGFLGAAETRPLPVLPGGIVDADALPAMLEAGDVGVVSVQWANNETGVIQPIEQLGRACRNAGVPLHVDATQWIGKMPASVDEGPGAWADMLTFAPHKFHGPKGVGVLRLRKGTRLRPQIQGTQELGRRGGTENVPAILGAGVAADEAAAWLADESRRTRLADLRDRLEQGVLERVPDAVVNRPEPPAQRLWNTTNIAFPGLQAEAILLVLSELGVAASAGAACSSGSLDPSPVLLAMGVDPRLAHGSVRFSLSRHTTPDEIDTAIDRIAEAVRRIGA